MRRLSAVVLALVLLGASAPAFAFERETPRLGREPRIIKFLRSVVKLFDPRTNNGDNGPPKP